MRVPGAYGRIDIVISTCSAWIYIENKPYAGFGERQLQRYLEDLLSPSSVTHRALIYLPTSSVELSEKDAPDPQTISAHGVIFAQMPWTRADASDAGASLPGWLHCCRSICRAPRITAVLDDLIAFVAETFAGVTDMAQTDALAARLAESGERLEAAFDIAAALGAARPKLVAMLFDQLKQEAPVGWSVSQAARQQLITLKWPGAGALNFALEWIGDWRLIYGLRLDAPQPGAGEAEAEVLRTAMPGRFAPDKYGQDYWPAREWGETSRGASRGGYGSLAVQQWARSFEPWARIQSADREFAKAVTSLAVEVAGHVTREVQTSPASAVPAVGLAIPDAPP